MSNMMLACPVISDDADVTGSAVAGSLPLSNLKTMAIGQVTRFTTPASARIKIDLGPAPAAIDLIALLGHNASIDGTAAVSAADSLVDLDNDPDYQSGELRLRSNIVAPDYNDVGSLARNHFLLHIDTPLSHRFWRIDMSDDIVPYLDVGRLYLSKVFQPHFNMDYGTQEGFIDPSSVNVTTSGRDIPNERPKKRYTDFTLSFGSEEEMFGAAFDIDNWRGSTRDVLFIHDYDNKPLIQKRSLYGRMTSLHAVTNSFYSLFEKTYRIEEIIK